MIGIRAGLKALAVLGAVSLTAACASYPNEPRYSIFAEAPPPPARTPAHAPTPVPSGEGVLGPTPASAEAPSPARAPISEIDGGALDAPAAPASPYGPRPAPAARPASEGFASPPPPASGPAVAGAVYEIQPGDTVSGIGRRFQTPVQTLIDLNGLGPRADVSPGQRLILPTTAVDIGGDPYATGPTPAGMRLADAGVPPPPPPPPSREPAATAGPTGAAPAATTVSLDWPVRGEILRRFGPVGMGERNNGINIGAPEGSEVRASAAGRVGYVGDDLAGQGLTVLIVHRDGWRSVYGHLGRAMVRDGDDVQAGQAIGTVGTTAGDGRPSMHFETWRMRDDEPTAIDPLSVLPR
ncbi:MAG: peptidoglycan DD-metalloendopeptidase family protein [Brevundimonas sp.]|nr:peptidoglycan DD-metalloendopeptidase family protein [Brevundimonas sp.]